MTTASQSSKAAIVSFARAVALCSPACSSRRAAAAGGRGGVDVEALGGQHRDRGGVDVAEEHALHAAWSTPTRPRVVPRAAVRSGRRLSVLRSGVRGASSWSELSRAKRLGSPIPRRRWSAISGARARSRPGWGNSAKIRRRYRRSPSGRGSCAPPAGACPRSACRTRPRRQAVTHAMQPRQLSKWLTCSADSVEPSSRPRASGRSARAASPSPRPRARRSGRWAGRSRSARTRG